MSDNWLRLVPLDPNTIPAADAATAALVILAAAFPRADAVRIRNEEAVVFYDAGSNTEGVACPACGSDVEGWWGSAMDTAFAADFADLDVTTPCCETRTSLNDLVYDWPAAFGRFSLEIRNPGLPALPEPDRDQIERLLGTRLKVVWQHL